MLSPSQRFAPQIESEMRAIVPSDPDGLFAMVKYHLGWLDEHFRLATAKAGKYLRPTICLLCTEATGEEFKSALPAAAALELLHNFSLVHDDIQDRSPERRHRSTVWKLWGEAQAINVGDALFALAHQAVFRLAERGLAPALTLSAVRALESAALALCGGQFRDLDFESRQHVTTDEYLAMVRGKTAALMGCSAFLGGLLGSGNERRAEEYQAFGDALGVAFQIQDDILGIWGDPAVTGKPAADDVRSRKKTMPVVFATETLTGRKAERLADLYALERLDDQQVAEVITILEQSGACERAERLAGDWLRRALGALDAAQPRAAARQELRALAESLVGRTH